MSFVQMKDIVKSMASHSVRLGSTYEDHAEFAGDEELKRCLLEAAALELRLATDLSQYLEATPPRILEVWFQSPGLRQLKGSLRMVEDAQLETKEDAILLIKECELVLATLYESLASSMSQDVRDVFFHLKVFRQQNHRNWVWQANRPMT